MSCIIPVGATYLFARVASIFSGATASNAELSPSPHPSCFYPLLYSLRFVSTFKSVMQKAVHAEGRVLTALVKRLGAPLVATRLSKEELCLTFSALERIHQPRPQQMPGGGSHSEFVFPMPPLIKSRALQCVPACVPREMAMIAAGCRVLHPDTSELTDALVEALYYAASRGSPVTLADVTQTVEAAVSCRDACFNVTLHHLILDVAPVTINATPPTSALLERFLVCANNLFIRSLRVPQVQDWYKKIQTACGEDAALADVVAARLADFQTRYSRSPRSSQAAPPASLQNEGADETERNLVMRKQLFDLCNEAETAHAQTASFSETEVTEMMECFALYHWRDPVARDMVLSLAERVLRYGTPASVEHIKRAALHSDGLFQAVFRAARDGQTPPDALSPMSVMSRAYHMMVDEGRYVPADMIRVIQQTLLEGSETTAPRVEIVMGFHVLAVYARPGIGKVDAIARCLEQLTSPCHLAELAVLVRCMRRDETERIAKALEPSVTASCAQIDSLLARASLEELTGLAKAFSAPTARSTRTSESLAAATAAVIPKLAAALAHRAELPHTSQQDMITIVRSVFALPTGTDFSQTRKAALGEAVLDALYGRVAVQTGQTASMPNALSTDLMRLFTETDRVHEPLMDLITARFAKNVEAVLDGRDAACAEETLCLAVCQLELDTPELHHVAWRLLKHVSEECRTRTFAVDTLLAALAVAISPTGNGGAVVRLMDFLTSHPFTSLSESAVQSIVHILASVGSQYELPVSLVTKALGCLPNKVEVDGALQKSQCLEAILVASSIALDAPSAALVPDFLVQAALQCVTHADPRLFSRLCRCAPQLAAREIALTSGSTWIPLLIDALVTALPTQLDYMSFKQIADCVFYLGQTPDAGRRLSHQVMANEVADYVVNSADELLWSGRDIARLLRGLTLLHHTGRAVFAVCTSRLQLRPIAATLDQPAATLLFAAMGDARFVEPVLYNRLSQAYTRHAADLNTADLFLSVCSHSRVLMCNDQFYDAVGSQLARRIDQLSLPAVLQLLTAYGSVEQQHDVLAEALAQRVAAALPALDANEVTNALTSLWLMGVDVSTDAHAAALISCVAERAGELDSGSLVKLCSILRDLHWRSIPLLGVIAARSAELYGTTQLSLDAIQCRVVLDTLGAFRIHAPEARRLLSEAARTVSKDTAVLPAEQSENNPGRSQLSG